MDPGNPRDHYRLICDEDDSPVGEISYHRMNLDTMTARSDIKIGARFRGRGFAQSAMRQFMEELFTELGGRARIDDVPAGKRAGQRLLESFGFELTSESQISRRFTMTRERFMDLHARA